ncbi:hypothetical protein HPB48_026027 [Haemaphysalis longicornis]|uniref:CCHC-type domain-containing protein n=1 Tax=Haemaphysalis longicornis TaxID=44386 RepID=A0A9J6HBB6_HAELO|nr:hypothetical protein HPB48_026027 [Haemaphysalis longicornis]
MADIAAKPQPFLPDPRRPAIAWREWHRSFETYLLAAGCEEFTPKRKAALLKTFLGTEADRIAHIIESACPMGASDDDEYKYLVQGLSAHFNVSTSQRANRIQFRSLCQAETESAIDFARRVQYVGRQCNFGSDEAASLVDQLIVGLASDRTRERLLTEVPALTFDKAIEVVQNVTEIQDLLQRYRAAREEIVQVIDGTQRARPLRFQRRPTRFSRREFRPTISTNRSAPPSRPGLSLARTSALRSPACGRCGRLWHPLQQCPALGKTCFQCGKIGHFRNACRTPRPLQQCPALRKTCFRCGKIGHFRNACRTPHSATRHPSSPSVKRYTRPPLRNIETSPDGDKAIVVNHLDQHENSSRQGFYYDVKKTSSDTGKSQSGIDQLGEVVKQLRLELQGHISELAESRRKQSQMGEEIRLLKSQLADLRKKLQATRLNLESAIEPQEGQEEEANKNEGDFEKADEADKPGGDFFLDLKEVEKRKEAENAKGGSEKADEADKPEGGGEKDNEEDKRVSRASNMTKSPPTRKRRKRKGGKETMQCVR